MEEAVVADLVKKFPFLAEAVKVQRPRRVWLHVDLERFREVFEFAAVEMGFCILCTITGLDEGERFGLIYHLAKEDGTMLNIKTDISRDNPSIETVTRTFPGAEIYEREMIDLFGIKVEGLLEGKRYPLPDDWPEGQYPLRKDWKPGSAAGKERKDA